MFNLNHRKNMKKVFLSLCVALIAFSSCDKLKQSLEGVGPITIDYKMFEDREATKKVFDDIVTHLGDQAKVTDEIKIYISRPAHEGTIKKPDKPDQLSIVLDVQHPENLKRIRETRYWSEYGGWQAPETMEVNVTGSSSAIENFRLEDELFDFSANVNFDTFFQVLTDAFAKYKNEEKYSRQYIKHIDITENGYSVTIFGILSANDQGKSEYYKADFNGKARR
jgi:hypothetical protein